LASLGLPMLVCLSSIGMMLFLATTFLINRVPTKVLNFSSPLEQLFKEKTNFESLHTSKTLKICFFFEELLKRRGEI
jgi:hypothetical protein